MNRGEATEAAASKSARDEISLIKEKGLNANAPQFVSSLKHIANDQPESLKLADLKIKDSSHEYPLSGSTIGDSFR